MPTISDRKHHASLNDHDLLDCQLLEPTEAWTITQKLRAWSHNHFGEIPWFAPCQRSDQKLFLDFQPLHPDPTQHSGKSLLISTGMIRYEEAEHWCTIIIHIHWGADHPSCCSSHPSHGGSNIKMLCCENNPELAISIWKHNSFIYWLILVLCRTDPILFYFIFFFSPLYCPFLLILLPLLAFVWFYFGNWARWNTGVRGKSIPECIKADCNGKPAS